jgi:hypothetical protein
MKTIMLIAAATLIGVNLLTCWLLFSATHPQAKAHQSSAAREQWTDIGPREVPCPPPCDQ